jgi:hypothetical protein
VRSTQTVPSMTLLGGCVTTATHVDYNAFRDCELASSVSCRIHLFRASRVTSASGESRAQSMFPAAWCFDGTATSPLANNDAVWICCIDATPHPQPGRMHIWCPSGSGCLQLPCWFRGDLRLGRCQSLHCSLTTARCPWMCNLQTSFLVYLSPKQRRHNLDGGCPWRPHTRRA